MTTDALDALFRRLVLAAQQAGALSRPIEVAELLDTLIPYRTARREGLLHTNDDYLHCVMQLIAGERGYVFADDLLQDDLKNELSALNPDLSVLTTYRSAKLRISTTAAQRVLDGDTSIDLRPPTPAATDTIPAAPIGVSPSVTVTRPSEASAARASGAAPRADGAAAPRASGTAAAASFERVAAPAVATPVSVPMSPISEIPVVIPQDGTEPFETACPYCSQSLPQERALKYCPHCGLNLRIRRCAGCSAEMEAEWKFCVTCGRSAS